MNALRRRKELSDKCDAELQLREEVKFLGIFFLKIRFVIEFESTFFSGGEAKTT